MDYVDLPLAVEFGKRYGTIGFDKSQRKLARLSSGLDPAGQLPAVELREAARLELASDSAALSVADFIFVAVPRSALVGRRAQSAAAKGKRISRLEALARDMAADDNGELARGVRLVNL